MRPLSTAEEDLLLGTHFHVYTKLEVETSSGGYTDLSALSSHEWFVGGRIEEDVDLPVAEAHFSVLRDAGSSMSLSPLRTDSTLNQTSSGGPKRLVDVNREAKLSIATIPASCSPGSTDYKLLFRGDIDLWDVSQNPMRLRARDPGAFVQDQWVQQLSTYGSSSGTALHTVIQNVLDEWASSGISLFVPSTPTFLINQKYEQNQAPVMEAVRALAGEIGYELRYRWSSSEDDFRFTLYDVDRDSTVHASTFGPSRYEKVNQLSLDRTLVRNQVSVWYPDAASTEYTQILVESTSSQDRFGLWWMEVREETVSQIDTSSEAATLANAILNDLKDPVAEQEIDMHLWPPVELGDIYVWQANDVHYDTDQAWAVTGFTHELEKNRHRTTMRVRGKPSGGYLRWFAKGLGDRAPWASISPLTDDNDNLTASFNGNDWSYSVRVLASKTAVPSEEDIQAETAINGQNLTSAEVGAINDDATGIALSYTPGEIIYIGYQVYGRADGGGLRSRVLSWVGRPPDADQDSEVGLGSIGFDTDGHLIVNASGDPDDTDGIFITVETDGTDPDDPYTQVTTTDQQSSGSTVFVASTTPFAVGSWIAINVNGTPAYWGKVTAINAGVSLTVSPALSGTHNSGQGVFLTGHGKITSDTGSVVFDGTGDASDIEVAVGARVHIKLRGRNESHTLGGTSQLGPVAGVFKRRRGDAEFVPPRVIVQATRSGSSVSVDFTIHDPSSAISANPSYKRRDGDDQTLDASWQTSWNTSTGTAGTDTTLVRKVTLADPYTAIVWRAQYTDELGNAQEIGDELDLASVQELEKTLIIHPAQGHVFQDNVGWHFFGGHVTPETTSASLLRIFAPLVFPTGVELTQVRQRLIRHTTDDSASATLGVSTEENSVSGLASLSRAASTSWGWESGSLAKTVSTEETYTMRYDLVAETSAGAAGAGRTEITYNAPSYRQTY